MNNFDEKLKKLNEEKLSLKDNTIEKTFAIQGIIMGLILFIFGPMACSLFTVKSIVAVTTILCVISGLSITLASSSMLYDSYKTKKKISEIDENIQNLYIEEAKYNSNVRTLDKNDTLKYPKDYYKQNTLNEEKNIELTLTRKK